MYFIIESQVDFHNFGQLKLQLYMLIFWTVKRSL